MLLFLCSMNASLTKAANASTASSCPVSEVKLIESETLVKDDRPVVLVIGPSRAGKSSLLNGALYGFSEAWDLGEDSDTDDSGSDESASTAMVFKERYGHQSCTHWIQCESSVQPFRVTLCDMPGLYDEKYRGHYQALLHKALVLIEQHAGAVSKILLVTKIDQILRPERVVDVAHLVRDMHNFLVSTKTVGFDASLVATHADHPSILRVKSADRRREMEDDFASVTNGERVKQIRDVLRVAVKQISNSDEDVVIPQLFLTGIKNRKSIRGMFASLTMRTDVTTSNSSQQGPSSMSTPRDQQQPQSSRIVSQPRLRVQEMGDQMKAKQAELQHRVDEGRAQIERTQQMEGSAESAVGKAEYLLKTETQIAYESGSVRPLLYTGHGYADEPCSNEFLGIQVLKKFRKAVGSDSTLAASASFQGWVWLSSDYAFGDIVDQHSGLCQNTHTAFASAVMSVPTHEEAFINRIENWVDARAELMETRCLKSSQQRSLAHAEQELKQAKAMFE